MGCNVMCEVWLQNACCYAGLPFRGAPLLLPVDLNIIVETAGTAVQASIVCPLVYTQLSPACIQGLRKLALSFGEPSRVRPPPRPSLIR